MPYGTITSTENTFGTVNGALSGTVAGTLTGSVGVPGPVGPQGQQGIQGPPGPPGVGGAWGSIVGTLSAQTDLWTELGTKYLASNPAGYQTAAEVSSALSPYLLSSTAAATYQTQAAMSAYLTTSAAAAGYYPLTGNPSGFLTASSLTPYLTKADNLGSLTNFATARDNLGLGTLSSPTFAGITAQGSGANVANLTPTSLSLTHATSGSFTIQPSSGITFPNGSVQTTAFNASVLLPYAPLLSPVFTGNPQAPTAAFGDNDTTIATTAFVQAGLLGGTANARNLEVQVRNQSGSTIPAGSIVYISGATGNLPLITLAQANNDANSAQTMGFTKTSIANNGTGYVIVRGVLENINTSALTEGVQLYLSPTTPGTWTTTKPVAPQHLVYVGIVIRSHVTLGTILVAVQNGYELDELHDVLITTPTTGQVLTYDAVTGLWKNQAAAGGAVWGGITGTLSSQTDLQSALNAKYDASNPSGFITSSALAPYLLSSTAASTYLTQANASATYFTIASAAGKANLSGATFTGKVNMTPVAGVAGLNVGIGGTSAASTTNGDLWISSGGTNLNFRDGTGSWRILVNTSNTNTFSAPQIIDTTATTAALRVTQKGTGLALVIEDETTPDPTPALSIDASGRIGIGVAPDPVWAILINGTTASGVKLVSGALDLTSSSYIQFPSHTLSNVNTQGNGVSGTFDSSNYPYEVILNISGQNYAVPARQI